MAEKNHPNSAWAARYGGDFDLATWFLDKSRLDRNRRRWTIRAVAACLAIAAVGFAVYQVKQARLLADQAHRIAEAAAENAKLQKERADAAQFALANVANELTDYGVEPRSDLKTDVGTKTPVIIPGATRLTTPGLVDLLARSPDIVLIEFFGRSP